MKRVGFDFANTCPRIDKEIAAAQGTIRDFIAEVLDEACPLLPRDLRTDIADKHAGTLYGYLEDCFESVRATNEEMRAEADRQINRLQDEIGDLEHELRVQGEAA